MSGKEDAMDWRASLDDLSPSERVTKMDEFPAFCCGGNNEQLTRLRFGI